MLPPPARAEGGPATLGDYVLLSRDDLGMHCMNRLHEKFSILPPFNNLYAPVSTELRCVGCHHSSEQAILNEHEHVPGFDPNNPPILCASCHASPALGTPGDPEAGYFSFVIHKQHDFIDEQIPGIEGCYQCHPGVHARCLRGTMGTDFGLVCQDCHGGMHQVADSIEHGGRVPWLSEPACRTYHTARFGGPAGGQGGGGAVRSEYLAGRTLPATTNGAPPGADQSFSYRFSLKKRSSSSSTMR